MGPTGDRKLTIEDGMMRLRMHLNRVHGQGAVHLEITAGTSYDWGWSLYFQDRRPEHVLVGHGPVLFNRFTGELVHTGSAWPESRHVERYEFAIGVRDSWQVVITGFTRSRAHFIHAIAGQGMAWDGSDPRIPLVFFTGPRREAEAVQRSLAKAGVDQTTVRPGYDDPSL